MDPIWSDYRVLVPYRFPQLHSVRAEEVEAQHGLSNLFNFGQALNIKLASQPDQKLSNWMTAHYVATFRTSTFHEGTTVDHFCNHMFGRCWCVRVVKSVMFFRKALHRHAWSIIQLAGAKLLVTVHVPFAKENEAPKNNFTWSFSSTTATRL